MGEGCRPGRSVQARQIALEHGRVLRFVGAEQSKRHLTGWKVQTG